MGLFNKREPTSIVTDAEGLARIVRDLFQGSGFSAISHGVGVNVRPVLFSDDPNDDRLTVILAPWQADHLLSKLPRRTLVDEYGA